MSRNSVETDARGTANLIHRIHATSLKGPAGRLQWSRELVQNELDAGADRIEIDGYELDGAVLMRVSGNGSGMTEKRLRDRLTSIGIPEDHSRNFGVGARFATLPENHAGVSWISLVPEDKLGASLCTIHYERGAFSFVHRNDDDGEPLLDDETGEKLVIYRPWKDSLPAYIERAKHGTAVLLHGQTADTPTYSYQRARDVFAFLSRRYWSLPAKVHVSGANMTDRTDDRLAVVPLGDWIEKYAEARGTVAVPGATVHWSVLQPIAKRRGGGMVRHLGADFVGVRVGNEIVERRDRQEVERFGIYGKTARGRVILVVEPDGAELDLTRSRAVTADGDDLPWRAWREAFVAEMPEEIRALLPTAASLDDLELELAKLFDGDWMDRVDRGLAHVGSRRGKLSVVDGDADYIGKPEAGEPTEDPTPRKEREATDTRPERKPAKPRKTARRTEDGKHGREVERPAIPTPVYVREREDWPELFGNATFAGYLAASNEAFLYCPDAIVEETERGAAARHRQRPADMVRLAVERALMVELCSKIVHSLVRFRRDRAWTEEDVDSVLDARSLSMSLLGFHAVDAYVDRTVADLERDYREAEA